jgi:LuxR family maltose regulon positive regulatory protein
LHEKTEGWAAALRIVASTRIQSRQDFAQYVRNLSGTQRPIGTYLDEIFDGLPREMVEFMFRTAILNRLCTPLCDKLDGRELKRTASVN